MLIFLGVLSILVAVLGFAAACVAVPAWLDDEFGLGFAFLIVGLVIGTGGIVSAVAVDHKVEIRECNRDGSRLAATTKVFGHSDCRFYDESTGRWLSEGQWVYKNLGYMGE